MTFPYELLRKKKHLILCKVILLILTMMQGMQITKCQTFFFQRKSMAHYVEILEKKSLLNLNNYAKHVCIQ